MLRQADEVIIYLTAATNYKNYRDVSANPGVKAGKDMQGIYGKTFQQVKDAHIKEYKSYFDRFSIDLGSSENEHLPTNQRIDQFAVSKDAPFAALYVQYGRYLLISSSRPGTRPANLQFAFGPFHIHYESAPGTEAFYFTIRQCSRQRRQQVDISRMTLQQHFG